MAQEFVAGDRVVNNAGAVLFRRLPYMLSPQLDIYEKLGPFVREKKVLEVGFGTGIGVLQYSHIAKFTVAIEVDEAAVRFARRCFKIPNVLWEQNAVEQIFEGIADFIVMIEVLEHVAIARLALKKISDALKPKGQVLITVPNQFRHRRKEEALNIQEWSPETFNLLLLDYFTDVKLVEEDLQSELFNRNTTATPLIAICS